MPVVWSFPTRIVFGAASVENAGSELKRKGPVERVLVVSDPAVEAAGLVTRAVDALTRSGIECATYTQVSSSPLESEVLSAADAFRHANAQAIVAVGGGSSIDVAKLARVAASLPMPLAQYAVGGGSRVSGTLPPLLAIPTTAGSGSEVSGQALVVIQATQRKTMFQATELLPTVAILDPNMTATLPPRLTASTGMSALARCIEAYCALGDHPMADAIALNGIAQAMSGFERAVHDGQDLESRGAMLKASMMGSVAAQKGLGVCDALAHALATEANVPHGIACSILLPHVLDLNRQAVPDRVAKLARLFGVRGENVETLAFECAGAIRALRKRIGLPDHLAACNVDEARLARAAAVAHADPSRASNPRPCSVEDLENLLRAAL